MMIENVRQPQLGLPIGLKQPSEVQSLGVEPNVVARGGQAEQGSFAGRLGDALREVSAIQMEASKAQEQLVRGEPIDLHEVMIRQEESRIAFAMVIETRNKLVEAYQEIMRMTV